MTYRHVAFVFLGLFFSSCIFAGTAFAEPSDFNALAKEFSNALEKAQIHTVVISDFVPDEGRVSLQGVLLADRFWFALLQSQRGFRTLNRDLLRAHVYNPDDAIRKDEREAANAVGAEVLITGRIFEWKADGTTKRISFSHTISRRTRNRTCSAKRADLSPWTRWYQHTFLPLLSNSSLQRTGLET